MNLWNESLVGIGEIMNVPTKSRFRVKFLENGADGRPERNRPRHQGVGLPGHHPDPDPPRAPRVEEAEAPGSRAAERLEPLHVFTEVRKRSGPHAAVL